MVKWKAKAVKNEQIWKDPDVEVIEYDKKNNLKNGIIPQVYSVY